MVTAEKSAEELAKERLARFETAINLGVPDRVPLWGLGGDIIAAYAGITQHDMYYNREKAAMAIEKFARDFPCDYFPGVLLGLGGYVYSVALSGYDDLAMVGLIDGPMHDIIGEKFNKFPGREVGENATPQFLGGTFMYPEEYDELIEDPINFIAEKVVPRTSDNLSTPRKAMATWIKVGMELQRKAQQKGPDIDGALRKLGYPVEPMGMACAPLDIIGDFLRGFDQVMLDIYRYPDKVKKAAEIFLEMIVKGAVDSIKMGCKYVMIPLHLNEYLSPKLYNEFYWPTLKEVILEICKAGGKPMVFFEGQHEQHLETLLELPTGWGVACFEKTDVVKAKEVLKDHTCIMGGIPVSLLISGTPKDIDEYLKNLLEKVKLGGGFILASGVGSIPVEVPIENVTAIIEAVEKYGKY